MESLKRSFSTASTESSSTEDEGPSTMKKANTNNDDGNTDRFYSSIAQKLMSQMGYRKGKGLGKDETGRVSIIETSNQRGRRGLGMTIDGLDAKLDAQWNEDDDVMIQQDPDWMSSYTGDIPSLETLNESTIMAEPKKFIDDEYEFCKPEILDGVLKNKSIFDRLGNKEFLSARMRANPYETIRGAIFQNRAAMKMAEIDSSFDFMFTSHDEYKLNPSQNLLYFADICAGPGGFSEYVLWRRKWHAKGFGFTLRADWANDFKIEDFIAGTPETFDCHYGVGGWEGDGDIFKEENIKEFRKYVLENTENRGVHFVMADGGFSVEGQENIQEILSKQLYLCQFLCALSILRVGGHFICKVFDLFTPFSVGLVYLMNMVFEKTCIFKPVTSRPANSERYLICKGLKDNSESVCEYMFELNRKLNNFKGSDYDVRHVIPVDQIKENIKFYEYITKSNNELGARQILGLQKLATYVRNTSLVGPDQSEVRKQCLKMWDIPVDVRCAPQRTDPVKLFNQLMKSGSSWMSEKVNELSIQSLENIKSVLDYKCQLFGDDRLYLLSLGRSAVFKWSPSEGHVKWSRVSNDMRIELPRETLIEAELVHEYKGDGRGQRKNRAVHILDAIFLGGEYIGKQGVQERFQCAQLFAKALSKPCRKDYTIIRAKPIHSLNEMHHVFESLTTRSMKPRMNEELAYMLPEDKYFIPIGLSLIRCIKAPWHIHQSRSQNRNYYFNEQKRNSVFKLPVEAISDEKHSKETKLEWSWVGHNSSSNEEVLNKDIFLSYVLKK